MAAQISTLPTPPSRQDPSNFNDRADAFLGALPAFQSQANALSTEVNTRADDVQASHTAVLAATNITKWASGTNYAEGAVVWSPINGLGYRKINTSTTSLTTDPSQNANYRQVNGTGDVGTSGNQTITGVKTFSNGLVGNVTGNVSGNLTSTSGAVSSASNYLLLQGQLGIALSTDYPTNNVRVVVEPSQLRPFSDNNLTLGTSGLRWSTVYSAGGVVTTSDEREKEQIEELNEAELRVAVRIKSLIRKFKFKNIQDKVQVGVIAQDVVKAFQAENLNAFDYAVVDYQSWASTYDSDGNELSKAGDRYGVNYDQLFAFVIAAL